MTLLEFLSNGNNQVFAVFAIAAFFIGIYMIVRAFRK